MRLGRGEDGDALVGGVASGRSCNRILMSVFRGGMLPGGIPGCVVELVSALFMNSGGWIFSCIDGLSDADR
jgi:hypothetical protein